MDNRKSIGQFKTYVRGFLFDKTSKLLCSEWINNSRNSWETGLAHVGFRDQLLYARPRGANADGRRAVLGAGSSWPRTSFSTVAMIHLAGKWFTLPRTQGGLLARPSLDAARQLFAALFEASFQEEFDWPFVWVVEDGWTSRWPRPEYYQPTALGSITVQRDGSVDIRPLAECPHSCA